MNSAEQTVERPSSVRHTFLIWIVDLTIVLGFVAAIYPTLVFTRHTLRTDGYWSDLLTLAQPTFAYTGQELRKGNLPLWNPYWFAGFPHLAMPSACVFYPTTLLFAFLSFEAAVKIVVLLHCFLAGAFSYALGRSTFPNRVPALFLAFTSISGDFVFPAVRGGSLWTLQTLTWFPLAVLLINRMCAKGGWGSVVGFAGVIALMVFGGDTQSLAFCLWFLGPYVAALLVAQWWARPPAWRDVALRGAMCLAGVLLGFGLAGVQLAPSRELFAESIRANGVSREHMLFLGHFWTEIASFFRLNDDDIFWIVMASSRTVIALATVGLIYSQKATARAAAFATLPCLLYALMPQWFYELVVRHLPTYNGVRGTFRILAVVWWVVTYLSAFGVAAWTSRSVATARARNGIAAVTLGTLVVLVVSSLGAHISIPPMRIAACALAAVGAALFLFQAKFRVPKAVVPILIIAAAGLELSWKANTTSTSGDSSAYEVDPDVRAFSSARQDIDRIALMYHWTTYHHGTAVALLTRDRGLQGYHGLNLSRYARLFRDVADVPIALTDDEGRLVDTGGIPEDWLTEKILPLLDLFNVRHIVAIDYRSPLAQSLSRNGGPFTRTRYGKAVDYTNTRALPPVFPIHDVVWCASDADAISLMRDGRIDFRRQVTLTGTSSDFPVRPATGLEPVTLTEYAPERIAVSVSLSAPAILVFSEMYYPGWEALVDGTPREVLCVDTAIRGVRVDEGRHEVVLRYRPPSLIRGALISLAAVGVILCVSAILAIRRSRRRRLGATSSSPV